MVFWFIELCVIISWCPRVPNNWYETAGETYQKTDKEFLDSEKDTYRDDGSTASTAVLVGNHLYVANVGDSRTIISKAGKGIVWFSMLSNHCRVLWSQESFSSFSLFLFLGKDWSYMRLLLQSTYIYTNIFVWAYNYFVITVGLTMKLHQGMECCTMCFLKRANNNNTLIHHFLFSGHMILQ